MSDRSLMGLGAESPAQPARSVELRTFSRSGYEILDDQFEETGELAILATDGLPPLPGHTFTVEWDGLLEDVIVGQVTRVPGGWAAICRLG